MLVQSILSCAGPCFELLFSGRARAPIFPALVTAYSGVGCGHRCGCAKHLLPFWTLPFILQRQKRQRRHRRDKLRGGQAYNAAAGQQAAAQHASVSLGLEKVWPEAATASCKATNTHLQHRSCQSQVVRTIIQVFSIYWQWQASLPASGLQFQALASSSLLHAEGGTQFCCHRQEGREKNQSEASVLV